MLGKGPNSQKNNDLQSKSVLEGLENKKEQKDNGKIAPSSKRNEKQCISMKSYKSLKTIETNTTPSHKKKYQNCLDIQVLFKRITQACYKGSSSKNSQKDKKTEADSELLNIEQGMKQIKPSELPRQSNISQKRQNSNKDNQDKQIKTSAYPNIATYKQIEYITVGDKINYHLDILDYLPAFIQNIKLQYQDQSQWYELISLIYRKYYLERKKIQKFFKKYPMVSPFKINNGKVSTSQMLSYMKLSTGKIKLDKLMQENQQYQQKIQEHLSEVQLHSTTSKTKIEIEEKLLSPIIKLLWQYILVTKTNKQISNTLQSYRICRAMQIGFIIAALEDLQQVDPERAQQYIANQNYHTYVDQYFNVFQTLVLL